MLSSPVMYRLSCRALGVVLCMVALGGCGGGKPQRVSLVPVDAVEGAGAVQLSRDVVASLPDGAAVTLASGVPWKRIGAIVQGDVYRALGEAFTIPLPRQAGANLVASSGKLVGFYLPGDGTYIELPRPVALPIPQRQ